MNSGAVVSGMSSPDCLQTIGVEKITSDFKQLIIS